MIKWKRFVGFTEDELEVIELSKKRKVKYEKKPLKPVTCKSCSIKLYYRAIRCPSCETPLTKTI